MSSASSASNIHVKFAENNQYHSYSPNHPVDPTIEPPLPPPLPRVTKPTNLETETNINSFKSQKFASSNEIASVTHGHNIYDQYTPQKTATLNPNKANYPFSEQKIAQVQNSVID